MSLLLFACFLGGCIGWSGCARSQVATQETEVPQDFMLTIGQGGGFAGLWSGYVIHADGTVQSWQGPATREDTTAVGILGPEALASLWGEIENVDYFNQNRQETGNMTSFIEITAHGTTHRTSWVTRVNPSTPSPLERLYDDSRTLAQGLANQ